MELGNHLERWFTITFYTRDGGPCRAWEKEQGTCFRIKETQLVKELAAITKDSESMRGAHAIGVYAGCFPGQSEWGDTKPKFYIYEGGRVEKVS